MNTYKLAITSPTYSCTHFFQPTDSNSVKVWSVEVNTMPGMGFGRQVSKVEEMSKEAARNEWQRLISWGNYRVN